MGTRADFYVGRGPDAKWLGSIAWDGYPDGIPKPLLACTTVSGFRRSVANFLKDREDKTLPENGWPWPWETSSTTDFAYAFDGGMVHASYFGSAWFNPKRKMPDEPKGEKAIFPDMSKIKQRAKFGAHSGVIVIGAKP